MSVFTFNPAYFFLLWCFVNGLLISHYSCREGCECSLDSACLKYPKYKWNLEWNNMLCNMRSWAGMANESGCFISLYNSSPLSGFMELYRESTFIQWHQMLIKFLKWGPVSQTLDTLIEHAPSHATICM
jgi:hypothetical protein